MRFAFVVLLSLGSACRNTDVCPPAQLSNINARYVAAAALACHNTPPSQCAALPALKAARLSEEKDAGCL